MHFTFDVAFEVFKVDLDKSQSGDEFYIEKKLAQEWLPKALAVYDFDGSQGGASLNVYKGLEAIDKNNIVQAPVAIAGNNGKSSQSDPQKRDVIEQGTSIQGVKTPADIPSTTKKAVEIAPNPNLQVNPNNQTNPVTPTKENKETNQTNPVIPTKENKENNQTNPVNPTKENKENNQTNPVIPTNPTKTFVDQLRNTWDLSVTGKDGKTFKDKLGQFEQELATTPPSNQQQLNAKVNALAFEYYQGYMLREVDRWKALQKNENFTAGWFNVLDGDLRAMDKLKAALSSASSMDVAIAAVQQFYTEDPSRGERFKLPGMNTKVKTNPNGTVKELKPEQVNLFEQHINESVAENENNIKNLKSFFAVGGLDGGRQHSWNLFDMAAQWTSGEKSSVYEERIKQLTELKAQVADLKANPSRAKFDALQDRYAAYMREQGKAWQKISANAEVGAKAVVVTAGIAAATATAIVTGPAIFAATTAYLTGLGVSAVATSGGALLTTTLGSGLTGGTAAVGTGLIANSSTLLNKETAAQYQSTFGTGAYSWQTISNNYAIGNQTGQLVGGNIGAGKILSGLKWTENLANSAKIGNVKLFKDATNVGTTVSSFTTSSGSELLDAVSGNSPNKQWWQRGTNIATGTLAGYLGGRTKLGETWKGDVGIGATTQSISSTANYGFTVEGLNDWLTGVAGDIGSASGGHVVKGINPSNTNYSKFEQAGVNHRQNVDNAWETHGKGFEGKLSLDNNGTYQKAKDFWLNKGWDDINPEALKSFTIGADGSKSISYTANGETREIKVNTDGSGVLTTNGQEVQIPVDQAQGLVELIGKYERAQERQNNLNNRPSPQAPQNPQTPKVQSVNPKTADGLDINIQPNNPKNNFDYKVQLTDPNKANAVIGELNLSRNLAGQWEIKNISNHSIEINGQPVGNGQALKVGNGDAILLNGHYFRIEGQGPNKGVKLAEIGLVEYQAITNQKQPKAQNNQQSSPQGGNNRVNAPTKTNSGLDIDLQRVSEFDYNLSIKNPDGSVNSSLNLERNHFGQWELKATNNQVSVNGKSANGVKLQNGDVINLNGHFFELKGLGLNKGVQLIEIAEARYNEVSAEKAANAQRRPFQNNQPSRLKVSAQTVEGKDIQFTSKSTFDYEVSIEGNAASIKRNFAGQWQISGNSIAVDGNPVNGSVNLRLNTQPVIGD